MFSLAGKHAFVTGGCQGIGRAVVERYLASGARVSVFDLVPGDFSADSHNPGSASSDLGSPNPERRVHLGSVTDERQFKDSLGAAVEQFGPLDILVNNAGIARSESRLPDLESEVFRQVLETNLLGVLNGIRFGAPLVRDGGSIINTASLAAMATLSSYTSYAVSKAGVVKLTQQAAMDLGARAVRVNAVCPGTTTTALEPADSDESMVCRFATALGRPGTPEEQAALFHFLAADESRYITGQAIAVDGGWLHGMTPANADLVIGASTDASQPRRVPA